MEIEQPNPATLVLIGRDVIGWRNFLSVKVPGAEFSTAYKKGHWDGKYYPGYRLSPGPPVKLYCHRGLWSYVQATTGKDCLWDTRLWEEVPRPWELPESFRDYQTQAFHEVWSKQWGRVHLATNAGKGAVIALLLKANAERGQGIILCGEIAVFDALVDECSRWLGEEVGQVNAGAGKVPWDHDITVAMIPTLRRRLDKSRIDWQEWREWLNHLTMVLVDEADRMGYEPILKECNNSIWRAGFSGTFPTEGSKDDLVLQELFGPILIKVGNQELIDREISAKPQVTVHQYGAHLPRRPDRWYEDSEEGPRFSGPEKRNWVYRHAVWENVERHYKVRSLCHEDEINVVVVRSIEHGLCLANYLACPFLYGGTSPEKRRAVLDELQEGSVRTIVATSILDRGTNRLGWATNLIFASGEGSNAQTLQRVGRGLRRSGGKDFVRVQDIMDNGHSYLKRQAAKRLALYHSEGFDVDLAR